MDIIYKTIEDICKYHIIRNVNTGDRTYDTMLTGLLVALITVLFKFNWDTIQSWWHYCYILIYHPPLDGKSVLLYRTYMCQFAEPKLSATIVVPGDKKLLFLSNMSKYLIDKGIGKNGEESTEWHHDKKEFIDKSSYHYQATNSASII